MAKIRLYDDSERINEYGIDIERILNRAVMDIIDYCRKYDISLRDAQNVCCDKIDLEFLTEIVLDDK